MKPMLVTKDGERVANPPGTLLLPYYGKPGKPACLQLRELEEATLPLYRQLQAI
jgi:hypothetical protein